MSHFFARCASQKTHGHARIVRETRAILARVSRQGRRESVELGQGSRKAEAAAAPYLKEA